MARVSLRPRAVAHHAADPSLLEVTYDVVVVRDDGSEIPIARAQTAPLRADPSVVEAFTQLLGRVGGNIERAVGLADPVPEGAASSS